MESKGPEGIFFLMAWPCLHGYFPEIQVSEFNGSNVFFREGTLTQMLHLWYIYQHLGSLGGKCRSIHRLP